MGLRETWWLIAAQLLSRVDWVGLADLVFPPLKDGKGMTYTRLSHVWLLVTPWTLAHQAPLSVEFSRPRNWCFQIMVLEKTLENPWLVKRSNQSILKEISHEYSLEGLMLKLKLQYFGHLMQRADSLEKTLMLGQIRGRRRRGQQRMRWLMASRTWWTWVWVNSGSWWWTGRPGVLWFMGSQRVGHDWATELNWRLHEVFFNWNSWFTMLC